MARSPDIVYVRKYINNIKCVFTVFFYCFANLKIWILKHKYLPTSNILRDVGFVFFFFNYMYINICCT